MIEIAQPPVSKPNRDHTVAGFPLRQAGGNALRAIMTSWCGDSLVAHSIRAHADEDIERDDSASTDLNGGFTQRR